MSYAINHNHQVEFEKILTSKKVFLYTKVCNAKLTARHFSPKAVNVCVPLLPHKFIMEVKIPIINLEKY